MEWIATIEGTPATELTIEQVADLGAEHGASMSYDTATRHMTATFAITANTLRQALDTAGKQRVFDGRYTALRVVTTEQLDRELAEPLVPDLVGVSEAASVLGVSRQRIPQLAADHDDFPTPVAVLAAGPVYTRVTIKAFGERWTRKRTGRPRAAALDESDGVGPL